VHSTQTEIQDPAAALRERGYRATPQRLAVYASLVELGRHVPAERLLEAVSERVPGVSLPTVYSALEALEDAGLVRRVAAARGPALYDAGAPDHHHLVCRRCGAVEDLEVDAELGGLMEAAGARGFSPDRAEVVVHGLCAECARRT
jgi:Fur family transcriptional regulator, stress-responsive regulator